jgi:hypothetical protein
MKGARVLSNFHDDFMQQHEAQVLEDEILAKVAEQEAQSNMLPGIAGMAEVPQSANPYRDQLGDWYRSGLTEKGYLEDELTYTPDQIEMKDLYMADPQDFDPMRREAMNTLGAQQSGRYQTALTGMAASGGLTAADRMALASSFNRGGQAASAGLLGQIGTEQARNIWDTEQANNALRNQAVIQNTELRNQAELMNIDRLQQERAREYEAARDLWRTEKGLDIAGQF